MSAPPSFPFLPTGTVHGVLLNFQAEVAALAPQMHTPPYKAPPQAPVLYIKPANTWSPSGTDIPVPSRVPEVEVGASIAMVIGPDTLIPSAQYATENIANSMMPCVAGYVLVNDLSVPHASFFRPPVKFKCLDGFLGLGDTLRPATVGNTHVDPAHFTLQVHINGELRQTVQFNQLVRAAAQLLADVNAFMTLRPGDVLLLGCDANRPRAKVGDTITISAPGFAALTNTLIAEAV